MSRRRGKIYFVGGVNGVGKSSFLKELSSRYAGFEIFCGSTEFMKWLRFKEGNHKNLMNLPDAYKDLELKKMMRWVLEKDVRKNKTLIIDAHYLNYKEGSLVDVTGPWMSLLDALFVISASPKNILKRLKNDKKRGRIRNLLPGGIPQDEKVKIIDKFLKLTIKKAQEISKRYGTPLFIINNEDNYLNEVIKEFLKCDSAITKKYAQQKKHSKKN